jgi:AcrR family transcriptional regulator
VRGQKLRGQILRRAGQLASIDGLEQVSIARLAAAMEMSKSGLYAYFTSKQDLQLATIDCAWRVFEEHVVRPEPPGLRPLVERWIGYYEREVFPGGCLFVTAGIEFANREGPVRDALAAVIGRQLATLQDAVEREGVAADHAAQMAFELHALLTGANQRFRMSRDRGAFVQGRAAIDRLLAPASA